MRILRMIIECETPLHCGGGTDDVLDQPVSRDAFGFWRIPGTSLAGSLRALAASIDSKMADGLFGIQNEAESSASLVWCEDGLLLDYDGTPALQKILAGQKVDIDCARPYVRDHVRLGLESGTAEEGHKFDIEFVPAGARFLLEFRCDGWNRQLTEEEQAFFDRLASLILAGKLDMGGKNSLGYGLYRVISSEYAELDLATPQGMGAWLGLKESGPLPEGAVKVDLPQAAAKPSEKGLSGWIALSLVCDGPLLIAGGMSGKNAEKSEADMLFALTPRLNYDEGNGKRLAWLPMIPASSIRGVMRHAVYHVLKARQSPKGLIDRTLDSLFGCVKDQGGQCGRLAFTDCRPEVKENFQFVQHVAIDRFSAATITGALFSEEPFWQKGAEFSCRLHADGLGAGEAALLFHALLDLCEGVLGIGAGVNRGNGRLFLKGWLEDPQAALARISGNMAWNGNPLCDKGNFAKSLREFSGEWDAALEDLA